MGKTTAFVPLIIFFGFFGVLILGFFTLIFKLIKKGKNSSWEGKLVDKDHIEVDDDDSSYKKDYYSLVFETKEGKKIKVGVTKKVYGEYKIGDKAKKEKGKFHPEKIK